MSESAQLQAIRKGAQVLIATPGRLCDFLKRKLVNLSSVAVLVLDEADRMLDMGFLPTIKKIMAATPAERQTLFFSATIETSVAHLIEAHVQESRAHRDRLHHQAGRARRPARLRSGAGPQARPAAASCSKEEKGSFLVFARTKHGADRLAKKLASGGVKATAIHGDRTPEPAQPGAEGIPGGPLSRPGRHRRRRPRHSRRRHRARGELRSAAGARRLHPSRRPHRPRRRRGTASTFGTRSERAEIRRIERALNIQLTRSLVSAEVQQEVRSAAPVIEIPIKRFSSQGRTKPSGNFRFKSSRRRA